METLGTWLRQAREAKGATLEEVEQATRIRVRFLEALEAGDFAALPGGEVQVRGFLRLYARFLDLPLDEVLARYDAEVHGTEAEETQALEPRDIPIRRPLLPGWLTPQRVLVVALVLLVIFAIIWIVGRFVLPEPGTGRTPSTLAETTPAPGIAPSPTLAATFAPSVEGEVTLTLEPVEHIWVRVTVDGVVAFEGMLAPGEPQNWTAADLVIVETGNGAGVMAVVNGQPLGLLGGRGQIVSRAWGPGGEVALAPTPTFTPAAGTLEETPTP